MITLSEIIVDTARSSDSHEVDRFDSAILQTLIDKSFYSSHSTLLKYGGSLYDSEEYKWREAFANIMILVNN